MFLLMVDWTGVGTEDLVTVEGFVGHCCGWLGCRCRVNACLAQELLAEEAYLQYVEILIYRIGLGIDWILEEKEERRWG